MTSYIGGSANTSKKSGEPRGIFFRRGHVRTESPSRLDGRSARLAHGGLALRLMAVRH